MGYNKKSFLTTVVEASFLIWLLKAAAAGFVQALVYCLAKKKIEGRPKSDVDS